jgi:hypothetical protein
MTRVASLADKPSLPEFFCLFLIDIFFQFHPSALGWLWIGFRDSYWFVFYEVILILWLRSCIFRVNPYRLRLFYCVMFLYWFFSHFQHLTISLLKIKLHNLFWFTSMRLSQFHDFDFEFSRLIWVDSGYFFCLLSMRLC